MSDHEEKPLDPEVERVRRRIMRLMIISILIMLVGLIAVFAGVVYKFNTDADDQVQAEAVQTAPMGDALSLYSGAPIVVDLPEGATIIDKQVDGPVLLIDVRLANGDRSYFVVDLVAGKVATSINFE